MAAFIDLTGQSFNRLTVLSLSARDSKNGSKYWDCLCACGTRTSVRADSLKSGKVQSCGCSRADALKNRATHARSRSPEYRIWNAMKSRCHQPTSSKYYMYGARGIHVCPEWRNSFEAFFRDMGERPSALHSIERKDGTRGYCKDNCVWADKETQANNTRLNRPITYQGETLNLSQWSRRVGVPVTTLLNRLDHRHLSVEEAFTLKPFQRPA